MDAAQEGAGRAELVRLAEAAGWDRGAAPVRHRLGVLPERWAAALVPPRSRSVSKDPGSRLLMVTPLLAICRATPAMKPVRPERAPFDRPNSGIGAFTALEVMLTMRPKPRARHAVDHCLGQEDRGQHVGVDRLDPVVAIPVAEVAGRRAAGIVDQDVRLRAGGQCGLAARLGGDVARRLAVTLAPVARRISSAVASSASAPRAVMISSTPSRASARAQPLPRPLLPAHTEPCGPPVPDP